MPFPNVTAAYDSVTNSYIPVNSGTWANIGTWDGFKSWNNLGQTTMTFVGPVIDRGNIGFFNLTTSTDVTGNISYGVFTSNTGAFNGEETQTTITPLSSNLNAFCGRYFAVVANVAGETSSIQLRDLTVVSSNNRFDIEFNDVGIGDLAGNIAWRILPMPRVVSAITNMTAVAHYEVGEYILDDYFQTWAAPSYTFIRTVGGINSSASSMAVANTPGLVNFPNNNGTIIIGNEVVFYDTSDKNDLPFPLLTSMQRGIDTSVFGDTTAVSHNSGTEVQLLDAAHGFVYDTQYIGDEDVWGTPQIRSKDRTAPALAVKRPDGAFVQTIVDARLSVLPEQYMDAINLGVR